MPQHSAKYGSGRIFKPSFKTKDGLRYSARYSIAYCVGGREIREPARTESFAEAKKLLHARMAGIGVRSETGPFTIEDLIRLVEGDYVREGRVSLKALKLSRFPHLRSYFKAEDITRLRRLDVERYRDFRKAEDAANGTINRETDTLLRGLRLAQHRDLDVKIPRIKKLKEAAARQGFFERADFEKVKAAMDAWWHDLFEVAYITGWRVDSELCPMRWGQVDFNHKALRLEPGQTKNGEGRNFGMTPNLLTALQRQRARVDALEAETGKTSPWVFPRQRTWLHSYAEGVQREHYMLRLTSAYKPFKEAAKAAGLPNALQHDFRRTAVRNLELAGVDRPTAKAMVGHKTDSMYYRYNIVDKRRMDNAVEKLAAFEAQQASA